MLPIDPDGIKTEWCDESCSGDSTQSERQAEESWDLALVGITYRFTGMMRLE